jgi:hypothetical protein
LRLDVEASAKGTAAKRGPIVAGKPDDNKLVQRIISTDDDESIAMPATTWHGRCCGEWLGAIPHAAVGA